MANEQQGKVSAFIERVFMETFTKGILGHSGDADKPFKEKGWGDNAKFTSLLLLADCATLANDKNPFSCSGKISQMIDYIIGHMDESAQTLMKRAVKKGMEAGVSTLVSAPNEREQLRRLIALPIISLFSEMSRQDSMENAQKALIHYCGQDVETMFSIYTLIVAQPETISDQAKRGLGWLKEKHTEYKAASDANIAKANAPGGITYTTKQRIARRKQRNG